MLPAPLPHIGIFDSGIGGLSVLRAVRQQLPAARCSYIADSLFTPWGQRSPAWVVARCQQISAHLLAQGADLIVVACNTATTQAIAALRARWPQQLFVGVEPGIKPAVAASRNRRVAVLATPGTLRSARLQQLVTTHAGGVTLLRLPCPGLAEAIEAAHVDGAAGLQAQLDALAARLRAATVDTVVLGCTHYPLVAQALQQRLPPGTVLVDTADAVARRVVSLLAGLPADLPADALIGAAERAATTPLAWPALQLLATGPTDALRHAARRWLALDGAVLTLVLPDPAPGV